MSSHFSCQLSVTYALETENVRNVFIRDSFSKACLLYLHMNCVDISMHAYKCKYRRLSFFFNVSWLGFTAHELRLHFSILSLDVASEIQQLTDWGNSLIAVQKLALHLLKGRMPIISTVQLKVFLLRTPFTEPMILVIFFK